jgi:hypothetical protein
LDGFLAIQVLRAIKELIDLFEKMHEKFSMDERQLPGLRDADPNIIAWRRI